MIWNSVGEFFHMGGYGLYVWGSVVVTFGFMVTELIILKLRRRSIVEHLGHARALDEEDADVEVSERLTALKSGEKDVAA